MCKIQFVLALVVLYVGLAQSWDFAVGYGDLLEFYSNKIKTVTVRLESQNLAALTYDEVHNWVLYVDKQSSGDVIRSYDISTMESKMITERSGRHIHGLAFDPATELLFFTDTDKKSINWISLKPDSKNNVTENTSITMNRGIPTDIAVDSCKGYIYWTNTNLTSPTIMKARFNGTDTEFVVNLSSLFVNTTDKLEIHSLAIDQQAQRMYWVMPKSTSKLQIYSTDLNGKNFDTNILVTYNDIPIFSNMSNILTVSKKALVMVDWHSNAKIWEFSKIGLHGGSYDPTIKLSNVVPVSVATNYKLKDRIQGVEACKALTSLERINSVTVGPFCVHGLKVNGQSLCNCSPGYTGERCDISVCENYCSQGNCSSGEGHPKCSCNAGYSGERCDVNACHGYCLHNGNCSLNKNSEPVCQCKENYGGDRCEVSDCLNYCLQGNCTFNDVGLPQCSCDAGYSGPRCEVNECYGYCLNNGDCSLNEEDEPACLCVGSYGGTRCETVEKETSTRPPTSTHYLTQRNLTLADIFSNWQKPVTKMTVILESS